MSFIPKNFNSSRPSDSLWLSMTCVVVALHCLIIGWSMLFYTNNPVKQLEELPHLVVQTVDLNSDFLALNSNPLPPPKPINQLPSIAPITPITLEPLYREPNPPKQPTQPIILEPKPLLPEKMEMKPKKPIEVAYGSSTGSKGPLTPKTTPAVGRPQKIPIKTNAEKNAESQQKLEQKKQAESKKSKILELPYEPSSL